MSSLATAPRRVTPEPAEPTPVSRIRRLGVTLDAALGVLLTAVFAAIVFVATGGSDLAPNTWVEIGIIAIAAASVLGLVLADPRRARGATRLAGRPGATAATVALFAALAALTYASIAWSVQPANSWVEANRTLAYLAAFGAAAALARLAPARWPAIVGAVGMVAVVVSGYALLTKVFPATLNPGDLLGRLRVPFDYWNATGLMAALGLPVCLWAGARPVPGRAIRALAVPATAILVTTLMLSYSRGALVAAVIGLAAWFVLAPLRLRGALILALGTAGGAIATVWALAHHAITHDNASLAARTAAGHDFGLVLLAVVVVSALAGLIAAAGSERVGLDGRVRRRIGTVLVVLVAMVPFAVVAGMAASSRGLTGEVSHVWSTLTSANGGVGNNPSRLADLSNSRPTYWREGLKVGEHALLAGVGAGGFDTARTRYSANPLAVAHAHSYAIETFADFGLIGVAVSLALLVAWALSCRRALESTFTDPRDRAERAGLVTLLAVVVVFGVSSLIDWTWFIPGVAVPALVAAGWLAGRGSVAAPAEAAAPADALPAARPLTASTAPAPSTAPPASTAPAPTARRARTTPSGSRPPAARTPLGRVAGAMSIVAAALVAGWFVWQPLHSSDSMAAALDALARHNPPAALADARTAAASDPVSVDPLWELSAIYQAVGNQAAARAQLVKAAERQPDNPQTWQQLGSFDLQSHRARLALVELGIARRLDRTSVLTAQLIGQARAELLNAPHGRTGSA